MGSHRQKGPIPKANGIARLSYRRQRESGPGTQATIRTSCRSARLGKACSCSPESFGERSIRLESGAGPFGPEPSELGERGVCSMESSRIPVSTLRSRARSPKKTFGDGSDHFGPRCLAPPLVPLSPRWRPRGGRVSRSVGVGVAVVLRVCGSSSTGALRGVCALLPCSTLHLPHTCCA
jgi:hypothetical protein